MRLAFLLGGAFALHAAAQQYEGDVIGANLPTIPGTEVAFFKIPDTTGANDHLTLINYYSHGTSGGRINEANIQRAVIPLHGLLRDPWNYCTDTLNALKVANSRDPNINVDSVAVLCPYFPNGNDKGFAYPWTDGLPAKQGSTSNALVWSGSKWMQGQHNQYPHTSTNTSTFYVLDTLVQYFNDASRFPNLKQIVLVGHSAGGQMLQRYAAVGPDLGLRVPLTYWIGNPNSYAWFSEDRPLSTNNCTDYDAYKNGFTDYDHGKMTYGVGLVNQGREAIQANYRTKQIAYARAMLDHNDHSSDCGSFTTGGDRHERFFFFLKTFPPTCEDPSSYHCDTVDLVPVEHDNGAMFSSDAGIARIFTDNFYGNNARAYDFGYPRAQPDDDPYPDPNQASLPNPNINYNVYQGNMTYQGCWANQAPLTPALLPNLMYTSDTNTIEACTGACANAGFAIAGMNNQTQCMCGNSLSQQSAVLVVDSSCYQPCPGNFAEICGGYQRLSVFASGYPTLS